MSRQPQARTRGNRGFTLVEMLIALVVLSIGMLGVAKLFVLTLQGNASATSRLYAVNLTSDLADRIRAYLTPNDYRSKQNYNFNCS